MEINARDIVVKIGSPERVLFSIPRANFPTGSKVLIKGRSGKGKSTFLHLLAGLMLPSQGHVSIGDRDYSKLSDSERSRFRRENFAIVFQKLNLIDHLTTLENVLVGQLPGAVTTDAAMKALASVGLSGRENDRTSVLSLGEQQRVSVARVLAGSAKIVFADEPTSSLDDQNAVEIMRLLKEACRDKTLIVVSHDHRIEGAFSDVRNFEEFAK